MFRIQGLDPAPFRHLYGRSDAALAQLGVTRHVVDATPGFPDRIAVRDMARGETALLLNYEHQPAATPYRARHAIFVAEGATEPLDLRDAIPEAMRIRPISLRAFDDRGDMRDADLVEGEAIVPSIERLLRDPRTAYLHAHYAKRGCYAARVARG